MRMRTVIVVFVSILLLGSLTLSSCNEEPQSEGEAGVGEQPESLAGADHEEPSAETPETRQEQAGDPTEASGMVQQMADDAGVSVEAVRQTKQELIALLPEYGLAYEIESDEIYMPDTMYRMSLTSAAVGLLVVKQEQAADTTLDPSKHKTMRDVLEEAQLVGTKMAEAEAVAAEQPKQVVKKPSFKVPAGYVISTEISGSWRSIREEKTDSNTSVNHDGEYYDAYVLRPNGSAEMRLVRYGEDVKNMQLTFEYDQLTGRLELTDLDGRLQATYYCLRKGDSELLFMLQEGRNTVKVFEAQ